MPIISLSLEKVASITKQMTEKRSEREELLKKHVFTIWNEELDNLLVQLDAYENKEE